MQDFEKLGAFYLGKVHDPATGTTTDDLILYDAKDLTTHAMIVGMTGSGKTGLALALIEEAAIDGIPALLIDPKGDLANLLLQFPALRPADFRPWIDESEAARKGLDPDAFATQTADTWRQGLARWGQDGARMERLKAAATLSVYTPGNTAGRPLQILRSFAAPPPETVQDNSALRDRVLFAVSGLLGLLGLDADPVQGREHILLSTVLDGAWRAGRDLSLEDLIRAVQRPPFEHVGVFDLESFYPAKDRMKLAMSLNHLLASPGFAAWMEGDPLNIQRLLYTAEGRPRVTVLSIAHLSDEERMFFVTALLNEVLAWVRRQPGTGSLRALLYMDEIFGYFPPTANPPSKAPMLTLLKQARAFGLGVVLSTQNPVDLDYKGLSNCGTWFIGRLQTERDKQRVIEGLEGAAGGGDFDRAGTERLLAGLGNRVFLMRNAHEDRPVVFETRWALSYLRGPLTLPQLQTLARRELATPGGEPHAPSAPSAPAAPPTRTTAPEGAVPPAAPTASPAARPPLPPGIPEFFVRPTAGNTTPTYRPALLGSAKLHYVDAKTKTDVWQTRILLAPLSTLGAVQWDQAEDGMGLQDAFDSQPVSGGRFDPLPSGAIQAGSVADWRRTFGAFLYQETTLSLLQCSELKLVSNPGEAEGDFRARLALALRELRDAQMARLRTTYAPKFQTLDDQLRRAQERVERERSQVGQQKLNTALSFGATLFGGLFSRRRGGTLSRAASAIRSAGRVGKEKADVERANDSVEVLQERRDALDAQFRAETEALQAAIDPARTPLASVVLRPRKSDITIEALGLCWRA